MMKFSQEIWDLARYQKYLIAIPGYSAMTRSQKKNARKKYNMELIDLDLCREDCPPKVKAPGVINYLSAANKPQKKEQQMGTLSIATASSVAASPELVQRDYLVARVNQVSYELSKKLRKHFGYEDDDTPRTPQQVVDRIKAGMFAIPEDLDDDDMYYNPWNYIRWRDPAKKKDWDGMKKAQKALEEAAAECRDLVVVSTPEDGLKALHAFRDGDYTTTA